jgi:ribosome-interacting GTPase 1
MGCSVILGDRPDINDECIRNNMVYINNDMTDDDIMDKIIESLNDKTKLNKFIYNNNKIAHSFSLESCVNIFDTIIRSIYDDK